MINEEDVRELVDHKVGDNNHLKIEVADKPGSGGANHVYEIWAPYSSKNEWYKQSVISFQNGPIKEVGINGVTQEALLAIIIDRLRSFQKGPFSCKENACALTHVEEALHWLQQRTIDRMRRGVEGYNKI